MKGGAGMKPNLPLEADFFESLSSSSSVTIDDAGVTQLYRPSRERYFFHQSY